MKYSAHKKGEKLFESDFKDVKNALKEAKKLNPNVVYIMVPKSKKG